MRTSHGARLGKPAPRTPAPRPVRDQPHRPTRHLHHRRPGRCPLVSELLDHPLPHPHRHGQLVLLGPHLGQLLDQLLFEFIQLRAARGDPLMHLGVHHAPERTSATRDGGARKRKTRTYQTIYTPDCRLTEQPRRQAVRIRSRTSGRTSNPAALYVATPPTLELGVHTRTLDEPISRSAAAPATVIARP